MTDSSDRRAPKSSRRKHAREPATIDLKATVIDDGKREEPAHEEPVTENPTPEETIETGAERTPEEVVAAPGASLDSGLGTDSLGPEQPSQEQPREPLSQESLSQEPPPEEPSTQEALAPEQPAPEQPAADLPPRGNEPHPAPVRRTSPAALIGSGVLGGIVGAGLVYYGLQAWQTPEPQDNQRLSQLEQRVNALGRPAAQTQQGAPQGIPAAVEERIQALEAARGSLDQRLQSIQGTAEQAAERAQQASARAEEAMNRPVPAAPAPQNDQALTDLSDRLSALENQVKTDAQNAGSAANAVQALERRVAEQESRVNEREQRAAERDRRVDEQEQRLAALSHQLAEQKSGAATASQASQAGTRVILAERLGDALRKGAPYAEVLQGLKKAGTDQARIAPLEPFAQEGAPTAAALRQSFEPLGQTILREDRAASGDWTDRVLHMMDRVVTVRPVNEPGSTGVPSLVARIEQALARGDVADAAAAWEALPEPSRRLSEDWGRQVKAVAEATRASQGIADNALAALNQTAQ